MVLSGLVIFIHIFSCFVVSGTSKQPRPGKDKFHTYDDLVKVVKEITSAYPNITMKEVIGKSTWKKDILAVKIGWNVRSRRPLLRPMVKFVANMHGNEKLGLELMILLMR